MPWGSGWGGSLSWQSQTGRVWSTCSEWRDSDRTARIGPTVSLFAWKPFGASGFALIEVGSRSVVRGNGQMAPSSCSLTVSDGTSPKIGLYEPPSVQDILGVCGIEPHHGNNHQVLRHGTQTGHIFQLRSLDLRTSPVRSASDPPALLL